MQIKGGGGEMKKEIKITINIDYNLRMALQDMSSYHQEEVMKEMFKQIGKFIKVEIKTKR